MIKTKEGFLFLKNVSVVSNIVNNLIKTMAQAGISL